MIPKISGTFLGVPILRIIAFGGLPWGSLFRETTILTVAHMHEQEQPGFQCLRAEGLGFSGLGVLGSEDGSTSCAFHNTVIHGSSVTRGVL